MVLAHIITLAFKVAIIKVFSQVQLALVLILMAHLRQTQLLIV